MTTNSMDLRFAQEAFEYDPVTGVIRWRERPLHHFSSHKGQRVFNNHYAGMLPGLLRNSLSDVMYYRFRYRDATGRVRQFLAHRIIWLLMAGEMPEKEIDHIDGNGLNNKWSNLRSVDRAVNRLNMPRYKSNRSGVAGVSMDRASGKFQAHIGVGGKTLALGRFDTLEDAAAARREAERLHGFHANHGRSPQAGG